MLPPRVDSVEPPDGGAAATNTVVFKGNLLRLSLKSSPPVVREEPGGEPVPCTWAWTSQHHGAPGGMVGGEEPTVLTVWFPASQAGKTLSAEYLGRRVVFTVAVPVREVPLPPEAAFPAPKAAGGWLEALRRVFRRGR